MATAVAANGLLSRELGFLLALARAAAGALLFALPLFMTQEMWQLGIGLERWHLIVFLLAGLPLLTGLCWYAGFKEETCWQDAVLDALVAYAVAFLVAAALLFMLGILDFDRLSVADLGSLAVQAVPTGMGAAIAQSQLGGADRETKERRDKSYWGELFLAMAGALFLAFNIAPTEEVQLLTYGTTPAMALVIVAASVSLMHAFVYGVGFRGQERAPAPRGHGMELLFTAVSYVLALTTSFVVLWVLGQTAGQGTMVVLHMVVVLGFPATLGAAAARLIL